MTEDVSDKSYGTAVILCGVFGILGVHHFYLGNIWHGLADLGLVILFFWCLSTGNIGLAYLALMLDVLHTAIAFYLLIVERWRDGTGRRVVLKT